MREPRPKNLNLFTIRFPLPAIISILHRVTGVFLFLLIPLLLWALETSLNSDGFYTLMVYFDSYFVKAILWLMLIPLCFHLLAGLRHLLSDVHLGDTLSGGRRASMLTLIFFIFLIILVGVWLW